MRKTASRISSLYLLLIRFAYSLLTAISILPSNSTHLYLLCFYLLSPLSLTFLFSIPLHLFTAPLSVSLLFTCPHLFFPPLPSPHLSSTRFTSSPPLLHSTHDFYSLKNVVDLYGKDELIYLGPDEQVADSPLFLFLSPCFFSFFSFLLLNLFLVSPLFISSSSNPSISCLSVRSSSNLHICLTNDFLSSKSVYFYQCFYLYISFPLHYSPSHLSHVYLLYFIASLSLAGDC